MKKNYNYNYLQEEIETARNHMINLASVNPLTSEEVLNASIQLDKLLNKLIQQKK